jgi:diguanylate cyclase (GGDEF)-like protein
MGQRSGFLRGLLARHPDPYEGADLQTMRRATAALLGLCALLCLAFLPLEPVDDQIGWLGWPVAALLILAGLVGAIVLVRSSASFDALLAVAYLGTAGIAMLNWFAGGGSSAYEDLFVLWAGAGAAHPPRRALLHLLVLLCALALPLLYESTSGEVIGDMLAEGLILVVLDVILIGFLYQMRRQRTGLRTGVEVARRLARVDALTGLGNRRAFDEALTVEAARAARENSSVAVGLVDVDNLKRVNDNFGHLEGDRCLRDVARAMERSVRKADRCFRWGGDEFVVVLPSSNRTTADSVLVRLADAVTAACEAPDGRPVNLTWAVAEIGPGTSPEDALAQADVALLERKAEKRR